MPKRRLTREPPCLDVVRMYTGRRIDVYLGMIYVMRIPDLRQVVVGRPLIRPDSRLRKNVSVDDCQQRRCTVIWHHLHDVVSGRQICAAENLLQTTYLETACKGPVAPTCGNG